MQRVHFFQTALTDPAPTILNTLGLVHVECAQALQGCRGMQ